MAALDEAAHFPFAEGREENLVNSHTLAVISWREGNYQEALRWYQIAEEEQTRFSGNWVPDLTQNRKRLEAVIASQPTR